MITKTFEYCSLQYLNQWLSYDKGYCDALASCDKDNKITALRNAGGFYRVARNVPSEYDEKKGLARYEPVLEIIDSLKPDDFKDDPVKKIDEIAKSISNKYGDRGVLSLTTKFLWIKIKQPILIYDSQARIAIGTENGDLLAYYEKWREGFEGNKEEILEACSKLTDMNKYAVNQEVGTKEYIKAVSGETWFHERVYDIYLWSKGNNT